MGILLRNHARQGSVDQAFSFGTEALYPTLDEQYIVATVGITNLTAAGAFTLNASGIGAMGNFLLWPQKLCLVLRNRGTLASGPPGITQANPTFAGTDQILVRVVGLLNGVSQTEDIAMNIASVSSPTNTQRSHQYTTKFYDEVTSISLVNTTNTAGVASDFGTTTALQFSVGLGAAEFGDASAAFAAARLQMLAPCKLPQSTQLRRISFHDETNYAIGATAALANLNNETMVMTVPGRAADFTTNAGLFVVDTAADTLTKTAHGLVAGNTVKIQSDGDGVPGNIAEGTRYYVGGTVTADALQLSLTPGGAAIDLTAVAPFANGEYVRVLRPTRQWKRIRVVYSGRENIG